MFSKIKRVVLLFKISSFYPDQTLANWETKKECFSPLSHHDVALTGHDKNGSLKL